MVQSSIYNRKTTGRTLIRVQIHVERIIDVLKNKYTLSERPLPNHSGLVDAANIDKILVVCAYVTNLSSLIVVYFCC